MLNSPARNLGGLSIPDATISWDVQMLTRHTYLGMFEVRSSNHGAQWDNDAYVAIDTWRCWKCRPPVLS